MWSSLTGIIVIITTRAARNVTTKVLVLNVYLYSPIACHFGWLEGYLSFFMYNAIHKRNILFLSRGII